MIPFLFQLSWCKCVLFLVYLVSCFLHFLGFLLVISVFTMAPECSAEMLSSISLCKKAVTCLMEKLSIR